MSLLGLDIGTTGCKAIVFREDGTVISAAYREYPLYHPCPGWAELDPDLVWSRVEQAIGQAIQAAGNGDPVRALAASVQGEAVCPVDRDGNVLANSIVTFDNRTVAQSRRLGQAVGPEQVYRISGQPLHPMGTINKIAWWKQNCPDIYEQTDRFLCYGDFALMRLGLPPVIDTSMAARTMAYDIEAGGWSGPILGAFGIDEGKLPAVAPSGTAVGRVPDEVCDRLGLPRGVIAATGGHDQPCGALGAGASVPGRAMYAIGTVECVTPCLPGFLLSLGRLGFPCYPHVAPDLFVTLGFNFGGGSVLRWYRDTFAREEMAEAERTGENVYDLITANVDTTPGRLLLLPHFAGTGTPWLDPMSKGVIAGLTLGTTREDIVKAILEGTTYEIAVNVLTMRGVGVEISELRAIGGGARSAKWLQIKSDILGIPLVTLRVSEAACLGAAILAGHGLGIYPDVVDASTTFAKPVSLIEPDETHTWRHMDRLDAYRRLYPTLRGVLQNL